MICLLQGTHRYTDNTLSVSTCLIVKWLSHAPKQLKVSRVRSARVGVQLSKQMAASCAVMIKQRHADILRGENRPRDIYRLAGKEHNDALLSVAQSIHLQCRRRARLYVPLKRR